RYFQRVAPLAGAWIETQTSCPNIPASMSHPSRVRGLKLAAGGTISWTPKSHPSRVRGLKRASWENPMSP
ncbi:hypothetical protein, partial [Olavius algarvensis spirochete endosymbiont]|uniref:hypothetical protein n=1 Tax=Olavius algarvensis spirochete endosymbiont TaxID=260710 RepID=UPI003FA38FBD